jgi:hypothetical protein
MRSGRGSATNPWGGGGRPPRQHRGDPSAGREPDGFRCHMKKSRRLPLEQMYAHGVGQGIRGVDTHDRRVREIAYGAPAAVLVADYGSSPERHFPVATWKI